MFSVDRLTPEALAQSPDALSLIAEAQSRAGRRCLHTDFTVDGAQIARQNAQHIEYVVLCESAAGRTIGAYGVEVADQLRRAWLRGPFVAPDAGASFEEIASALLDAFVASAGSRVDTWDAYVETTHADAINWLTVRGFATMKENAVYVAKRDRTSGEFHSQIAPPSSEFIDAIVALSQLAFPGGYLTREDFVAPVSESAATFALTQDHALLGMVHVSREAGSDEAYIDYLAVDAAHRGKGYGRALLRHALAWALLQHDVAQVALTVLKENIVAASLYESAGFELLAVGRHLRLHRSAYA